MYLILSFFLRDFVMDPTFLWNTLWFYAYRHFLAALKSLFSHFELGIIYLAFLEDSYIISNLRGTDGIDDRSVVSYDSKKILNRPTISNQDFLIRNGAPMKNMYYEPLRCAISSELFWKKCNMKLHQFAKFSRRSHILLFVLHFEKPCSIYHIRTKRPKLLAPSFCLIHLLCIAIN